VNSPIVHFDIAGPDDVALQAFYERAFGWTVDRRGPGYALADPGGRPHGAIIEADLPSVTLGIGVEDLDGRLAAVIANGGTVVMPATDNGWVTKAQVSDPAGNLITLIQQ
jgi:predicted enzyme related to lactoylglutathione lyase